MAQYSFAATRPVNPPGVEPVLTEAQAWKSLEYKLQNPMASALALDSQLPLPSRLQRLVPNLSAYEDSYDEKNNLVRQMTFVDGKAFEVKVEAIAPTIMYFEVSTGMRITNVISYGANNELLLTYSFANGLPYVPDGQPKPSAEELTVLLAKDLDRTLAMFREALKEGKF
ncbi:hypothetical protein C8R46DRAFT_1278696 [Mycena filopes]|nr:hypothetical protein C8R46DRAFT_1278696 [Mycena filopes]